MLGDAMVMRNNSCRITQQVIDAPDASVHAGHHDNSRRGPAACS
jgi:hypothetical protein